MKVSGLLAFVTVFLVSSAYADRRDRGLRSSLLEPEHRPHGEELQRRKPPGKPPGPALVANDQYLDLKLRQVLEDEERNNVYLAERGRKHSYLGSNDENHKHFVDGDHNVDNEEENHQEGIRSLIPE